MSTGTSANGTHDEGVSRSDIEGLTLMPFGGTSFNQAHRE